MWQAQQRLRRDPVQHLVHRRARSIDCCRKARGNVLTEQGYGTEPTRQTLRTLLWWRISDEHANLAVIGESKALRGEAAAELEMSDVTVAVLDREHTAREALCDPHELDVGEVDRLRRISAEAGNRSRILFGIV